MRPSLRFLCLAVGGWAGVRAYSTGALPAGSLRLIAPSEAKTPPPALLETQFPPIEPVQVEERMEVPPAYQAAYGYPPIPQGPPLQIRPVQIPVYYGVQSVSVPLPPPRPLRLASAAPEPDAAFYPDLPPLNGSPLSQLASISLGERQSRVIVAGQSVPVEGLTLKRNRLDRLQLSSWALLRGQQGQLLGPASLANGGQLGGSQAGARLTYAFNRRIAASLRTSSDVGRRGAEFAAGFRVQPLVSLPIWVTAERRQRLGRTSSGRNAFAVFAETGFYQQPLPWQFNLDAYLQSGVVGLKSRDWFVDGAVAATRPVYKNFSGGFGVWGGAQPGLYRIDVGPRVTMKVRNNIRMHLDYRYKVAGTAQPGSGPAITLAADF